MTPIGVYATAAVRSATAADAVLASLPLSYAPGQAADGNVTVVAGSSDWPGVAADALDAGAAAVIVVHPQPADTSLLDGRIGLIALDTRWAANPVVEPAASAFAAALPQAGRLECEVRMPVGTSLEAALLDQLGLVRGLLGPVSDLRVLTRSSHGYAAEGAAAGHPVDLTLVCTDAVPESASVRLLTVDGSVDLHLPSGATAQPARLTTTGPDGTLLSPTLYESGHRATWRRVRSLLSSQSTAADLDDFASDRQTARTALQLVEH